MIFQVIYRTNETYIGSATSKEALFLSIQQTLTATSRANQTPIQKTIDRDPNIDNYQFHILDPDDNNLEKYILLLKPELNHIPIKDPNNGMTGKTGNLNPFYGKKHSKETILFLKTLKRKTGWKQSAYQKRITSERCKKVKIPPTPEEILAKQQRYIAFKEKARQRMIQMNKSKIWTKEDRERASIVFKSNNPKAKV